MPCPSAATELLRQGVRPVGIGLEWTTQPHRSILELLRTLAKAIGIDQESAHCITLYAILDVNPTAQTMRIPFYGPSFQELSRRQLSTEAQRIGRHRSAPGTPLYSPTKTHVTIFSGEIHFPVRVRSAGPDRVSHPWTTIFEVLRFCLKYGSPP
jgi:hypothetical protein